MGRRVLGALCVTELFVALCGKYDFLLLCGLGKLGKLFWAIAHAAHAHNSAEIIFPLLTDDEKSLVPPQIGKKIF